MTTSTGASSSGYGFTNEYQSQGLIYLRARHYAPGMGRFLTRDTWPGESNRPLSLNRWGYVEGNPVNLSDPSGKCVFWPPSRNAGKVESKISHLSKSNWLNTYTAAGLAMQCWGEWIDGTPEFPFPRPRLDRGENGWPEIEMNYNDSW